MGRLRLLRPARDDLTDLWVGIAKSDPSAADRILDRIEGACARLKDHPRLGPARPDIGPGARILIIDRWLAIYRVVPGGVDVARVVDGARDLRKIRLDPPGDRD